MKDKITGGVRNMITQRKYASRRVHLRGAKLRRERILEGKVIGRVKRI